jgi:hypothetical protein
LNVPAMQQTEAYIGGADKLFDASGKLATPIVCALADHGARLFERAWRNRSGAYRMEPKEPRSRPTFHRASLGNRRLRNCDLALCRTFRLPLRVRYEHVARRSMSETLQCTDACGLKFMFQPNKRRRFLQHLAGQRCLIRRRSQLPDLTCERPKPISRPMLTNHAGLSMNCRTRSCAKVRGQSIPQFHAYHGTAGLRTISG